MKYLFDIDGVAYEIELSKNETKQLEYKEGRFAKVTLRKISQHPTTTSVGSAFLRVEFDNGNVWHSKDAVIPKLTVKSETMKTIKFGILVNLGSNNSHYLQAYDRLQHDTMKIDVSNYLKTFDRGTYLSNEEMIDDEVKMFADDAKWVKNLDGEGFKSQFFLVCYIADETGVKEIEEIKEIFY